jgi:hypothetical protein
MSVIMRFGVRKAILCGARWRAADPLLERTLNAATGEWLRETGGPALGDADPDFTTALTIGVSHGGRVQRHLPGLRASTRDAYLRARQLSLF